ncbi:MAG: hypothetical protein OXU20_30985 [Myxococcales bacterium]|nr:hypothetical protein [Myxococcales bacterium]
MSDLEAQELYALSSPLSPADAAARLRRLGPSAPRVTPHRQVLALELLVACDPLSAPIEVEIESRHSGSFVTVRVGENAFLRDFARVVRIVLTAYALGALLHICVNLSGAGMVHALVGVVLGWTFLLSALAFGVRVAIDHGAREIQRLRLRHQLARLLCR